MKQSRDVLIIAVEVGGPQRKTLVNPPAQHRLGAKGFLVVIARSSPA